MVRVASYFIFIYCLVHNRKVLSTEVLYVLRKLLFFSDFADAERRFNLIIISVSSPYSA